MIPQDFFVTTAADPWGPGPSWDLQTFNSDVVSRLRSAPLADRTDLEAAIALAALVHDELQAYGTDGKESLSDPEMTTALVALTAVTKRTGITFEPPFRNFTTFRSFWLRKGAANSWQVRPDLLEDNFWSSSP